MIIIAHNIRSMYNVGSIFRNAAAFDVEKLYLTGITAQPPRKEIAKVALGAQDLVDWEGGEIGEVVEKLKADGYKVYGLEQGEGSIMLNSIATPSSSGESALDDQRTPSSSPINGGGLYLSGRPWLKSTAREMRHAPTPSEKILWEYLRGKRIGGLKFRRQHLIGPYIVDFYCNEYKLIIEIDGSIHKNQEIKSQDIYRQQYLEAQGYIFLRFTDEEVVKNTKLVLDRLIKFLPSIYGGVGGGVSSRKESNSDRTKGGSSSKLALILGNEVEGIDPDTISKLDGLIEIPMGKKRSLNVAVASGIAMYELTKRKN